MCGRVILSLFSILFPSVAAATIPAAQCGYPSHYSVPLRATYFDAAVSGNELWVATGYGVQVLDRSVDPPAVVASVALPGTTRAVDIRDGVAYVGSGQHVHQLRRNGTTISGPAFLAGAQVNDVIAVPGGYFAATTEGLALWRVNPVETTRLQTSGANVLALATSGTEIFAADGDATVERFDWADGRPLGTISALPRSTSVAVAANRLFISDGQQTAMLTVAGTPVATLPFGASTVLAIDENIFFVAGSDRRYRVVDLSVAERPVELFAADIIPSGGTVNRIGAIAGGNGRVYIGGGDAGLVALDTSRFVAPFPVRAHPFGAMTSSVDSPGGVFVGNAGGGITELRRLSSGRLDAARTWESEATHLVHDFHNDFLLTSSGATLTYWSVQPPTPAVIARATMPAAVRSAVIDGTTALAVLADHTIWSIDLAQQTPAPVRTTLATASFIARSDRRIATAEASAGGTTEVRFYRTVSATPAVASVPGAPTAFAFDGETAAVFTFRGITLIDFSGATPLPHLLPESNTALVRDLAIRGNALLDVTASGVRLWDIAARRVSRTFALPAEGAGVSAQATAAVATVLTADGVVSLHYDSPSSQPAEIATIGANQYATKIVATPGRLFVFETTHIDVYETRGGAPRHATTIATPGAIDIAASDNAVFVLFSNRDVISFTHGGTRLRSATIDEGTDTVPRFIFVVAGAPWVAVSRGCLTTGCEERTVVLDPVSLVRTAALEGGARDVVTAAHAYALMENPPTTHLRAYATADPLHPALIASRPVEGGAVAVASSGGEVYTLGERLFTYAPVTLDKKDEGLAPLAVTGSPDMAIDAACAAVTGRSDAAETYARSGSSWTRGPSLPLPGAARAVVAARDNGTIFVLTDYSIEVWSRGAPHAPARRRSAR